MQQILFPPTSLKVLDASIKKDKIKFYYNARASVFEAADWCKKAYQRNLLTEAEYKIVMEELRKLPKEINYLIKMTENNLTR